LHKRVIHSIQNVPLECFTNSNNPTIFDLNPKRAETGDCQFSVGENYINTVQGRRARSILTITNSRNVTGHEVPVNIFSGYWGQERASKRQPVTIQTAGSMFLMIIDMGGIKQVWVGKCAPNRIIRGTIWDPHVSGTTPSFIMESQ
jgi:hypothetical protein